jgi:hypothetical protein
MKPWPLSHTGEHHHIPACDANWGCQGRLLLFPSTVSSFCAFLKAIEMTKGNRTIELPIYHEYQSNRRQLPKLASRVLKYTFLFALLFGLLYTILHITPIAHYLPLSIQSTNRSELPNTYDNVAHPVIADISHSSLLSTNPTIAKVTASFGPSEPIYEAAIASHRTHNSLHGYPHYILRERMLPGLWSKHSYLLTILGAELAKPPDQRLQWLFWHDRDTILMNANVPLEIFLPPNQDFQHVNLVVTRDRNGLNNGVFMVRVSEWAVKMFASSLSLREYLPEVELKYSEQSAMEDVIARVSSPILMSYLSQSLGESLRYQANIGLGSRTGTRA